MQIFKPKTLGLVSRTYYFKQHTFSIAALGFFKLEHGEADAGQPVNDKHLLVENSCWSKLGGFFKQGHVLDMGYAKANAEFLLVGNAYAKNSGDGNASTVKKMSVSVRLGGLSKTLDVVGDRHWSGKSYSNISRTQPFSKMPLTFSKAYGGGGFLDNPLGKGHALEVDNEEPEAYHLPNLYYPDEDKSADEKTRRPASFAPIDISWPQRMALQGTLDQHWLDHVHPGFPDDTNPRLFNAAPDDQQLEGNFQPNDVYQLTGMRPDKEVIKGNLPNVRVRAFVKQLACPKKLSTYSKQAMDSKQGQFVEINTSIDTVWFFPELDMGVVIYRATLAASDSDGLDIKQILLAYEGADDSPRSVDYYKNVLALRSDPETAVAHLLNESQLKPIKSEFEQAREASLYQQAAEELQQKKQRHLDIMIKQNPALTGQILPTADESDLPAIPKELVDTGDFDLTLYLAQANELSAKAKLDADKQIAELKALKIQLEHSAPAKDIEPLVMMQERVFNPIYVLAQDLELAGNQVSEQRASPTLISAEVDNYLSEEQKQQLAQAQLLSSKSQRQSRQNSPDCMVMTLDLAPKADRQIRQWVVELLSQGISLAGRDLSGADLSGLDFSQQDMRDVMLEYCNLSDCQFDGARLDGAVFTQASLSKASLIGASLCQANFGNVSAQDVDFRQSNLTSAQFIQAKFIGCDFSEAILDKVSAIEAELSHCRFDLVQCQQGQFVQTKLIHSRWLQARLVNCTFLQSDLSQSNWQGANISRCIMLELNANQVDFSQVQAFKVQFSCMADFRQVNLTHSRWHSCGFRNLDLAGCKADHGVFIECDLGESLFHDANLVKTLFKSCVMMMAEFNHADCTEALFFETSLRKSIFEHTDLSAATLQNCNCAETQFIECDSLEFVQKPMPAIG